jgi:hypothetical protein
MKSTFGIVMIILMPFIAGGLFLLVLKLQEMYQQYKYEKALTERNDRIERLGLKPFRGVKQYVEEDIDYSTGRDAYRFKRGVHR